MNTSAAQKLWQQIFIPAENVKLGECTSPTEEKRVQGEIFAANTPPYLCKVLVG
jgi:hypothetical protein